MQRFKIRSKVNKHQAESLEDITSRLLHLSTGFGGGKTHVMILKMLQLSWLNRDIHGGLVVPDFQEFKKDVLPEAELIFEKNNIPYRYHGSDHYFSFPWTKGRCYVVSAEKKIRGPNWGWAVINEVTLIPLVRYKEVLGRVRVKGAKHPQIFSVGTPEGFLSEYYDYFIESPPKNLKIIYGSTDDNLMNLDEEYTSSLEQAYDKTMLQAYRHGLWIPMGENRFYYAYDPLKNENRKLKTAMFQNFHCSMDFNVDPFCATLWGYDGRRLYGVAQVKLEGGAGYKTTNMIDALKARGFNPYNTIIYPDPAGKNRTTSGQPDIKILKDAGFNVRHRAAAPNFRRRQIATNNLLEKGLVVINPDECPGMRKDFLGVETDPVTFEKDKSNPKLTHFSDGFDYMTDILFPWSGDAKAVRQTRVR